MYCSAFRLAGEERERCPCTFCRTATAVSEASVIRQMGASGVGLASASLVALKEAVVASVQLID